MGRHHVRVMSEIPEVAVAGVVDGSDDVRAKIEHTYRLPTFRTVDELMERSEPDACIVAVPTSHHVDVALPLIEAKKHVLIEKPIADTVEHGEQLVAAAKKASVVLFIGHIERFNPAVIELKKHLDEKALGKIYQLHARRVGPFPPRIVDVGVTIDLATHDLNVMERVANSNIVRIAAETAQRLHQTREDMVTAILRFENGAVGTLDVNWLTPTKIRELWVCGKRGMFHVNYLTQDLTLFENASAVGSAEVLYYMGIAEGRSIRYPIQRVEPLRAELEHFVTCIRDGVAPMISGEEAVRALKLAQQAVDSAREPRENRAYS